MDGEHHVLGIDAGSVSIALAQVDANKHVWRTAYQIHNGNVAETLILMLKDFDLGRIKWIAATTSSPSSIKATQRTDNRIAAITASRHFHKDVGSILMVGGEKFGLIRFDASGNYRGFKSNTSCAAGTGSFLDQQASRLNLNGIGALGDIAFGNKGKIPKIASRCAVFAKTDLAHAQQEGYSLSEICDGLCYGLARNIVDTLFKIDRVHVPIVFVGGVSKNRAVVKHVQSFINKRIIVEPWPYEAIGAAFALLDEKTDDDGINVSVPEDLFHPVISIKDYLFEPLELKLSEHPDFKDAEQYRFRADLKGFDNPVEVDIYQDLASFSSHRRPCRVLLGIDVGSTSTKAVMMDRFKSVLAGFYTRTAGRPVQAIQTLFAAMDDTIQKRDIRLEIIAAGTTGAGRKFSGKIIRADLVMDEITAHARAAYEINPEADTILEIGGQDAKFTTMKNGMVTFSIMNTVCAAGTGSFIEEQARKLGCHLSEYSGRTEGKRGPITSDRCTVFMERDINYYLLKGYDVDEVLASVLHAIVENYLTKVAVESHIGDMVVFQGATAKNKALVAAFEQRLKKQIHVSKYCHLTGAMGVAMALADRNISQTRFKGLNLHKMRIPIISEVCELCTNHCKITVADMDGEKVAYGFLCGRDYQTKKFVNNNRSGFDLFKTRKKAFSIESKRATTEPCTIGLPAGLHMLEDLVLWKAFFNELGFRTVTSERCEDALKSGKRLAGAEFCAPITALHGHVDHLLNKSDFVFLPFYFDHGKHGKDQRRQYCYYTQFAPCLAASLGGVDGDGHNRGERILSPLVYYLYGGFHARIQLYRMLKKISKHGISFSKMTTAFDNAVALKRSAMAKLLRIYQKASGETDDFHVVLLGRPYSILTKRMNKGIPDLLASMGVKTFYQDMLRVDEKDVVPVKPLLNEFHWHYAAKIIEAASVVAKKQNAYPVFITSFKCSPDSFVVEYFKQLMDKMGKPYLILQLDEHDSTVGYETRIEAALRTFRNHFESRDRRAATRTALSSRTLPKSGLADKTLILPNWDHLTQSLVVANLRKEGIDARLLEETPTSIRKSLRYNTGQCIPMNIIAQEFMEFIENYELDPAKTVLWLAKSVIPCNLRLFPAYIQHILQRKGKGFEKAGVYSGAVSFADLSMKLPVNTYFAYMFGGMLKKMGCCIRPYEKVKGTTDAVIGESLTILENAFLGNGGKIEAVAEAVALFEKIETLPKSDRNGDGSRKSKVVVFGDLYARDNDVFNQDLFHKIESYGGEVVSTPYSSYVKMIAKPYLRKWFVEGNYLGALSSKALITAVTQLEKRYYKYFQKILKDPDPDYDGEMTKEILAPYHIRIEHTGESMDNILKIFYTLKHHPDISLFVQTSPAFCCPSLVTEAMAGKIERQTGVPVVSITYDGTGGDKNNIIIPYLKYPKKCYKSGEPKPESCMTLDANRINRYSTRL